MPFIRAACQGSDVKAGKGKGKAYLLAMFKQFMALKGKGKGNDSGKGTEKVDESANPNKEGKSKRLQRLRKLSSKEAMPMPILKKSPSMMAIEAGAEKTAETKVALGSKKKQKTNEAEEAPSEAKQTACCATEEEATDAR